MFLGLLAWLAGKQQDANEKLKADLERRVVERTDELARSNRSLQEHIARRTEMRRTLASVNARLNAVMDAATEVAIIATNTEGMIEVFNRGAELMLGYLATDLVDRSTPAAFHLKSEIEARGRELSEERGRPVAGFDVLVDDARQGLSEIREWTYICRNGSLLTVSLAVTAMRGEQNGIVGFLLLARDVTEQKRAVASLREQEAHLRAVVNSVVDGIITIDEKGRVLSFNPAAERIFGYSAAEIIGQNVRILMPESYSREHDGYLRAYIETGERKTMGIGREVIGKKKNNVVFPLELAISEARAGSCRIFVGITRDITARKTAEAQLRERSRLLALGADIGRALTLTGDLQRSLQLSAEAIVSHLEAAFARIWFLNESEQVLELQASAGMYTHIDGPHARVPVGMYKIGLIAEERAPHLTNDVQNDTRLGDKEWAKREGMVAFAGYPLIVRDQLLGVMAMFSRTPLPATVLSRNWGAANGELHRGLRHETGFPCGRQRPIRAGCVCLGSGRL